MKVCVSSTGKEKNSIMDERFGRCLYFVIFDTETKAFKAIENAGVTSAHGAGIAAGQQIVDEKVEVVITGHMGPNALKVLQGANIKVYKGEGKAIEEEIRLFQEGKLEMINQAGVAHFGMRNRARGSW